MAKKINDKEIWVRIFEVTEPKRHKKGFTVYKVVSTVFPRSFPEGATKIKVWKRYNDFKKLHKELELVFRQLYLKGEFPKFPKDKVFGRFDEELIEERRKCALALLEFAASYSLLFANKVFVKFFETTYSPLDFTDDALSSEKSVHPNSKNEMDEDGGSACLIPERIWQDKKSLPVEQEDDLHSVSSFTCSSPSPDQIVVAFNNEIDANLTSSALGETSAQIKIPLTSCKAEPPIVTTFCDANSSQSIVPIPSNVFVPSPYTLQESRRNPTMVQSISFADDYDISFEDAESPHTSGLTNSVSCLSLDTIPLNRALREPKDTSPNNPSVKTERKKQSGFGFFDFLPIFSKKQDTKVENDKVLAESLTASYICEAAGYIAVANQHESNSEFGSAFEAYKEGIQILLTGAQNDSDHKRRVIVRKKIENYLSKAETLKAKSIHGNDPDKAENSNQQEQMMSMSSSKLLSPRKKLQGLVERDSSYEGGFVVIEKNIMPSFIEELKVYKVVGCTFNNILVVVDTTAIGGPRCYAVKVFRKSAYTLDPEKPTLIPSTVPFMVQMIKWFNTDDSIIIVLQYAGGGRLVDFVKAYQTKHISPVIHDESPKSDGNGRCFTFDDELAVSLGYKSNAMKVLDLTDSMLPANKNTAGSNATTENLPLSATDSTKMTEKRILESEKEKKNQSEDIPCPNSSVCNSNHSKINTDMPDSKHCNVFNEIVRNEDLPSSAIVNEPAESFNISKKINPQNFETEDLIESSKVLIRAISRTLGLYEETKENFEAEQKVNFMSEPCADTESRSASMTINFSSLKNETTSDKNQMRPTTPSKLVRSFSRHLEDIVYNVPTFSSISNPKERNENFDDEFSPLKRMVPECCTKVWAAEIVIALEKLHDQGITYGDLDINNILLGDCGHILLSYRALWNEVDKIPTWNEFSAPEVRECLGKTLWRVHPSADWWSLGSILFMLITGQSLQDAHPEGIYSQTIISIPLTNSCGELITPSAKTLLAELLQFSPTLRLGYYGAEEIKSHPFFEGFDWEGAVAAISYSRVIP